MCKEIWTIDFNILIIWVCGNVTVQQNTRIAGGIQANPYSWPAQVYIQETINYKIQIGKNFYNRNQKSSCGGTLLNRYTVLGAAHCISDKLKIDIDDDSVQFNLPNKDISVEYTVYVGAHDTSFIDNRENPKFPTVKKAIRKVIRVNELHFSTINNIIIIIIIPIASWIRRKWHT